MYLDFFGFSEKPFAITPNPHFIFLSKNHREVFAHLLFGIRNRTGFVEVTGEVGSGKTTILRTLFNQIDNEEHRLAFIFNPSLSSVDLMRAINREYHIDAECPTVGDLFNALYQFLLKENAGGRTVVLVIDEAQNLAPEVLEQIRQLSNLETETEKLIQILLVGQPELGAMLARPELRQLSQRITLRYHLSTMDFEDTQAYINHRLDLAGNRNPHLVSAGALKKIFQFSGGLPRLINVICDRALLVAYGEDRRELSASFVDTAVAELRRDHELKMEKQGRRRWAMAACSVLLVAGLAASAGWFLRSQPQSPPPAVASSLPAAALAEIPVKMAAPTSEKAPEQAGPAPAPQPKRPEPVPARGAEEKLSAPVPVSAPAVVVESVGVEKPALQQKAQGRDEAKAKAKAAPLPAIQKAAAQEKAAAPTAPAPKAETATLTAAAPPRKDEPAVVEKKKAPVPSARVVSEPAVALEKPAVEPPVAAPVEEPKREKIIFGFAPSWNSSIRTMDQARRLAELLQKKGGAEIEVRMFRDEQVLRERLASGEGLDFALVHQSCGEGGSTRSLGTLKRVSGSDCGLALSGRNLDRDERKELSAGLARLHSSAQGRRLLTELGVEEVESSKAARSSGNGEAQR